MPAHPLTQLLSAQLKFFHSLGLEGGGKALPRPTSCVVPGWGSPGLAANCPVPWAGGAGVQVTDQPQATDLDHSPKEGHYCGHRSMTYETQDPADLWFPEQKAPAE